MSLKFVTETVLTAKDQTAGAFRAMQRNAERAAKSVVGLQQVGTKMRDIGVGMTTLADGAGFAVQQGLVQPALELRRALGEVASLDVSAEGLKKLEQEGQAYANRFGGITQDYVKAAYDVQSGIAGLDASGLASVTTAAAVMAKGTKAAVQTATSYLATMAGIFKDDMAVQGVDFWSKRVAGMSAQAVKIFKTDGEQIAQAFSGIGAAATSAGVKINEQMAILGKLQETMTGSEAATKYQAFLSGVGGAQEKLGLSFVDSKGRMLGTVAILEKIKKKYGDLSKVADSDLVKKAFGSDEAVDYIKLLSTDLGSLKSNMEELNKVMDLGPAIAMAEKQTDAFQRMSGSISVAREKLGSQLLPILEPLADKAGRVAIQIGDWAEKNPALARTILTVVGAVAVAMPVVMVLGATVASIGVIAPVVSVAVGALAAGIGLLSAPVIAVAAAVGAGIAVWKNWGGIIAWLEGKFPSLHDWLVFDLPDSIDGAIAAAQGAFGSFVNWYNSTTLQQKAIDIDMAPLRLAMDLAQRLVSFWNNISLKSLIPEIKMPSMPSLNFSMPKTGLVDKARGFFQGVKEGFTGKKESEVQHSGGRAIGGTVTAGGIYRVNERGPEILNIEGRQYLMATQNGTVSPLRDLSAGFERRNQVSKSPDGAIAAAQGAFGSFVNWYNSTTLQQKAIDIDMAPLRLAMDLAQRLVSFWNNISLKSLIPEIKMPSMPSLNFSMPKTGLVDKARGFFQGVKEGFTGKKESEVQHSGGRAIGGTVTAGGIYRVNERGPEILNIEGRQYLMATQNGTVSPLRDLSAGFERRNQVSKSPKTPFKFGNSLKPHSVAANDDLFKATRTTPDFRQFNKVVKTASISDFRGKSSPAVYSMVNNKTVQSPDFRQFNKTASSVSATHQLFANNTQHNATHATDLHRSWANAINAPVFQSTPLSTANNFDAPVLGGSQTGSIDADITIHIEADSGLRVVSSGVETKKSGNLVRNVGVSMSAY